MRKTMIMLSGGMDSTWALWKVLRDTGDEVHAHYCRMHPDARGDSEQTAAAAVAARLGAEYRPVALEVSRAIRPRIKTRSPHLAIYYAAAAATALGFAAGDRIVTGRNASDDETEFFYPLWWPMERRRREPRTRQKTVSRHRQAIIDMIFEEDGDNRPAYERLTPFPTREQMIAQLPADVLDMTVACSDPRWIDGRWMPCGRHDGFLWNQYEGDGGGQCFKCAVLARWLPRYRPENGWLARRETP